jgi:hypothetical protein
MTMKIYDSMILSNVKDLHYDPDEFHELLDFLQFMPNLAVILSRMCPWKNLLPDQYTILVRSTSDILMTLVNSA